MPSKKQGIQVYLRVRPTKKPYPGLALTPDDGKVEFNFQRDGLRHAEIKDDYYVFKFAGIFDMLTQQERVFDEVAKDVVEGCFEGYNGTIFAYGQTGSGKTFTITGGAERYADRGIIPRTLSYIFAHIREHTTHKFKVNISYMEIYNANGYDLLNEQHATTSLFDLPKVLMQENASGQFIMRNLSVHRAENEEDALNLLFIGDTNRVVSETPMNDASTRSHCIFVIEIDSQKMGTDVRTISKLHLVDLAGSERVYKAGHNDEKTISEAKNINSSLFALQMCIMQLNEKAKGKHTDYVGFRNSMMTMVLRDSLGGNCNTKMVAAISGEKGNIHESLGTCRFARSVQMIQNDMKKNERVDAGVIIQRLKKEVADLKAELALVKGEGMKEHLTSEDIERCNAMVNNFIKSDDTGSSLVLPDRLMIDQCFYYFRNLYKQLNTKKGGGPIVLSSGPVQAIGAEGQDTSGGAAAATDPAEAAQKDAEVQRLNMLVKQRDNEIGILLNYLNKQKEGGGGDTSIPVDSFQNQTHNGAMMNNATNSTMEESKVEQSAAAAQPTLFQMMGGKSSANANAANANNRSIKEKRMDFELNRQAAAAQQQRANMEGGFDRAFREAQALVDGPIQCSLEDLADRAKAFDMFRKSYRKNEAMEENRALLKEKYTRGKQLGANVNQTRSSIKDFTNQIEQIRKQNALRGMVDDNGELVRTEEEDQIQAQINRHKQTYQAEYAELKDLKTEIERIQNLLERCRVRMQKDFEQWLEVMIKHQQNAGGAGAMPQATVAQPRMPSAQMQSPPQQPAPTQAAFQSTDAQVQQNLQDFYKARDAIYEEVKR